MKNSNEYISGSSVDGYGLGSNRGGFSRSSINWVNGPIIIYKLRYLLEDSEDGDESD
jgi:hypothetical protein